MLNWHTSRRDFDLIVKIADRAAELNRRLGFPVDRVDILMDVQAAHCNGCPLHLEGLLEAPDSDFAHDVYGICKHIDRLTGKLGDCFSPRLSAVYHERRTA